MPANSRVMAMSRWGSNSGSVAQTIVSRTLPFVFPSSHFKMAFARPCTYRAAAFAMPRSQPSGSAPAGDETTSEPNSTATVAIHQRSRGMRIVFPPDPTGRVTAGWTLQR